MDHKPPAVLSAMPPEELEPFQPSKSFSAMCLNTEKAWKMKNIYLLFPNIFFGQHHPPLLVASFVFSFRSLHLLQSLKCTFWRVFCIVSLWTFKSCIDTQICLWIIRPFKSIWTKLTLQVSFLRLWVFCGFWKLPFKIFIKTEAQQLSVHSKTAEMWLHKPLFLKLLTLPS